MPTFFIVLTLSFFQVTEFPYNICIISYQEGWYGLTTLSLVGLLYWLLTWLLNLFRHNVYFHIYYIALWDVVYALFSAEG